jgi:sterol desaturase/sphingolipid hydroxylase (fatty acid hydroxylase superfamily)
LDLLSSVIIFIALEKALPLYKEQTVFRKAWQLDLTYFIVNHLLVGMILLTVNAVVHRLESKWSLPFVTEWLNVLPLWLEVLCLLLVADLAQYAMHRAAHEIKFLWRFHAIHHSVDHMDWLAGSRLHLIDILWTRIAVLGAVAVVGFSKEALDIYIIIIGAQAVLNHCNVNIPWGPLRHLIVTPNFHHWHHGSDRAAIDKNYAVHFAFIDRLFGTLVKSDRPFPEKYGLAGEDMPKSFWGQQVYPLKLKRETTTD